jgi:hypothetical protein
MVETFRHVAPAEYPGKASIIFYKNGGALELNEHGMPTVRSAKPEQAPYYMEAEINSPMVRLAPNESYAFDTVWFPTRVGNDFGGVTSAGIFSHALSACSSPDGIRLVGLFAVFFAGKLKAYVFHDGSAEPTVFTLKNADPREVVNLDQNLAAVNNVSRISIHLEDDQGIDRGMLGEVQIQKRDQKSADCQ